ncbi:MAG: AAA family ATPase [Leptolyngbya sp. UWPOB_LEPTO1]|uniref:ParA family protein n=1 Tax=Leptolyngbya sp. UWPOB_LEPTO1 TaxID=2815653 RepID=UPI001AC18287|nr:AAA family ATPase [Leptolyngbya sp. UWPOB_LEPTO1]MBN8564329.1 AAA family ATPase [Leptolyngbya sp. UWPOB_LEPTO1]
MKLGNTTVISFINLKGGVGKTTSAVNLAATLAKANIRSGTSIKPAKVLLIDLDPQSNASLTLLKPEEYNRDKTIVNLFRHELERHDTENSYDLDEIRIASIAGLNLDLIPSGLDLFDVQDELVRYQRYYLSATDILFNALNKLRESEDKAYTHIIIDCPPSLGLVTLNGLALSRYYIVPTLLDAYSHWGLDKIIERVNTLRRCKASCEVELLGILFSRVDSKATIENEVWERKFQVWEQEYQQGLKKRTVEKITFETKIPTADVLRKAVSAHCPLIAYNPSDSNLKTAKEKQQRVWHDLVQEISERIKERR